MKEFALKADFEPEGDQPRAIAQLVEGFRAGLTHQVLLGVTGSGKTMTMASVVNELQRPTLVLAPNKTLAAQLFGEFKQFFPQNAVEYFVSYYDYYQPEAYVPSSDTYIEKDASINEEIDKLRHSATTALFERRDVLIVASVSCIYGLGSPEDYRDLCVSLRRGSVYKRNDVLRKLVDNQYARNDQSLSRGHFRVRGDVVEIFPAASSEQVVRVEFFGDEVDRLLEVDALTGEVTAERDHVMIYPASHYVTSPAKLKAAIASIEAELGPRLDLLRSEDSESGFLEEAAEKAAKAGEGNPAIGYYAWELLGHVAREEDDARQALERALTLAPGRKERALVLSDLGELARRQNRPEVALARWREAIAVDADCIPAQLALAGEESNSGLRATALRRVEGLKDEFKQLPVVIEARIRGLEDVDALVEEVAEQLGMVKGEEQ